MEGADNVSEAEPTAELSDENKSSVNQDLRNALAIQLKLRIPKAPTRKPNKAREASTERTKSRERAARTDDPTNPLKRWSYIMHRQRIQTIKPIVDTSPPNVTRRCDIQGNCYNRRLAHYAKIERQNAAMLSRVSAILKGEPTVDSRLKIQLPSDTYSARSRQLNLFKTTLENLYFLKRLQSVKPLIETRVLLHEYGRNEKVMERLSMYPLHWKTKPIKGWESHIERAKTYAPIQHCYLRLGTESDALGTIVIELNYDIVPMTCENFRCLCTGELGISYKCSLIHRIVPGILWQGGDVLGQEGFGNKSIYGEAFPDENFILKHDKPGTVSMANCGPGTNGSQFIITARSTAALDNINVVFGKVTKGLDVLEGLNAFLGATGTPKCDIFITDCGMLNAPPEPDEEEQGKTSQVPDIDDATATEVSSSVDN